MACTWREQPAVPSHPTFLHPQQYTQTRSRGPIDDKVANLVNKVHDLGFGAVLGEQTRDLTEVRYVRFA